jgi:hypothetical protein
VSEYVLLIVPRWYYDSMRPAIEKTANWKAYTRGSEEYMACCLKATAYTAEDLLARTCGQDDPCVWRYPCHDYAHALRFVFRLLPVMAGVEPE